MKISTILFGSLLLSLLSMLSSCAAIAGIFKAGMGFGIFLVVLVIAAIVFGIMKTRKK